MIKKIILPFLLFLSSCSSEPQTKDRIFADLYVRYSQPLKETKAEARFSTGIDRENAKSMKINNGVIFQRKDMTMKEVPNKKTWWYVLTEKRDFSNTFTFSFPSSKHLKSDIEININALDELTIQGDFSKSKGVQFSWKGSPLSENESIAFLFKDEKNYRVLKSMDQRILPLSIFPQRN